MGINVYDIIADEYSEKKEELEKDFNEWLSGEIPEPKTKEVKEIISRK